MGYKKQSTMEDVFEICAMLPWWFGASVAVISYFIFHHYAVGEVINDENVGKMATNPSYAVHDKLGEMDSVRNYDGRSIIGVRVLEREICDSDFFA